MDSKSIDPAALSEYILLILHESHREVLETEEGKAALKEMVPDLLTATEKLNYQFADPVFQALLPLIATNPDLKYAVSAQRNSKKRAFEMERLKPYAILITSILLCAFIYWYSQRRLGIWGIIVV